MNYTILVIRGKQVVGISSSDEHPSEDFLRSLVDLHGADYCDVSRKETEEVS